MRRKDREITATSEILDILNTAKTCRLAMADDAGLYIVPLSYGYSMENDKLKLYFHGAPQGRKISAMKANSNIAFEIDCEHGLYNDGEDACDYTYKFRSIIGTGRVNFMETEEQKRSAFREIMRHQANMTDEVLDNLGYKEKYMKIVAVWEVEVEEFSAKAQR